MLYDLILLYHQLDVWKETSHPYENVDIHVKAKHVLNMELILRSSGIDFTVMIKDVQEAIMEETLSNQKLPTCYGYNYNRYNEYWKVWKYFLILIFLNFFRFNFFYDGGTYHIRNQTIDLLCKSVYWFLYDKDLYHERFKSFKKHFTNS